MATINKAENVLDDRLINVVTKHDRDIRELKSALQPIGADILQVQSLPTPGYLLGGPLTLTAGSAGTIYATITPSNNTLTLWNFLITGLVDSTDFAYQFPNGASLTTAQRNMRFYNWIDFSDSSDISNVRVFKARFENYDTASHSYYLAFKAYIPKLAGSTAL